MAVRADAAPLSTLEADVPFPVRTHPDREQAQASTFEWAQRMGMLTSEAAVARFGRLRSGHLAAYVYTQVGLDELLLGADWKTWMFMIDDQGDEGPLGRDPDRWRAAMSPMARVLTGDIGDPEQLPPVASALADLLERTCRGRTPEWSARLYGHTRDFLESYEAEAARRAQHQVPEIGEYIAHRRDSGAMHVVFDVAEALVGHEVPMSLYRSREFQDLELAASDVACWHNDIRSLSKELARDDVHNLVMVIQAGVGCSQQEAVDRAQDMANARMAWYVQGRRQMNHILEASRLSAEARTHVGQVLEIYEDWMSGHHQWAQESGRFTDIVSTGPGVAPHYVEPLLGPQ
ncbi:hypothetical protein ACIRPT_27165 [Streptomyces sp. NPDC101227]|uniref:terpene synthase family protein n=1 Tax=Streptomyces sp. NPDC101227 TaxID=3366136 RepID=UPI00380A8F3B